MDRQVDTVTRIVEEAQKLMQERGYNAFSYADISEKVGIRKASIHYHFPSKSDLAKEALVRYRARVRELTRHVDQQTTDPRQKLEWLVNGYSMMLREQNLICLCGVLGAELPTLPEGVRNEVLGFFSEVETWLSGVLEQGVKIGMMQVEQPLELEARLLLSTIQGALMVARAFNDAARFEQACERLISHVIKKT